MSHLHFSPERWRCVEANKAKCIFMIRDPRDVVISQAYYILRETSHRNHDLFKQQKSIRDCISLSILGDQETDLLSIGETLRRFEGWMRSGALVVRFEELVGSQGEGDDDKQFSVLNDIYRHIGVELGSDRLKHLASRTFSNKSPTFNNGISGRWREYFDEDLTEQFKAIAGEAIIRYGYENDQDW